MSDQIIDGDVVDNNPAEPNDLIPVGEFWKSIGLSPDVLMNNIARLTGKADTRFVRAWQILIAGEAPDWMIGKRKGPSGKMVSYIPHTHIQRLFNNAFRNLWELQVLDYKVSDLDGSVSSRVLVRIKLPVAINDGVPVFIERTIIEIGSQEAYLSSDRPSDRPNYTMTEADRVASSVSRGLVKAADRAFNIGTELRGEGGSEVPPTPVETWNDMLRLAARNGISKEQLVELCRGAGITKDNLVERVSDLYRLIYDTAHPTEKEVPI